MLRPSTKPRKRNSPRPPEKTAPAFKQWLRGRGCIFEGMTKIGPCEGPTEAMHLNYAGDAGLATKASDKYCVPSCHKHHALQHSKGWVTFLGLVGLSKDELLGAAGFLWARWPGRVARERKLEAGNG